MGSIVARRAGGRVWPMTDADSLSASAGALSGCFADWCVQCRYARVFNAVLPEPELAIPILNQCGAVLDPVAVIAVQHPVDLLHLRPVNMSTDDAVEAAPRGLVRRGLFEAAHVVARIAHAGLDPGGQ